MKEKNKNGKPAFVIGLDSSTTATKAIVWDEKGEVVASARRAIPLSSPCAHYYEQDPGDWWASASKVLQTISSQVDPVIIKGIAVSNQRETFVPLKEDGSCLRPAIVWLDERCKDDVVCFADIIGHENIHRITGKPVDYAPVVYRLAWMQKNESGLFKQINKVCDVHTYLVWKLTDLFNTSWASADPLGLFDLENKEWSIPVLSALGLTKDQLPRTFCPGTILGTISKQAGNITGLLPGTPVIAGGGDGQAAGLGVDALSSDRTYLNLGTAVVAGVYGTKYMTDLAFRTLSSCSDKGYYYECSLRAGTFALDWFIRNILNINTADAPDIYNQLEQEAQSIPAGSHKLLHLPYLCGVMNPYWDINARGVFIGLSSSHTRGHMYRSILEGIGFELFLSLSRVETTINKKIRDLAVIGGGAASGLWCQIIADITGKNICFPHNTEASCLGAGIAAAVGAGLYPSFGKAARAMTGIKKVIKPDMDQNRKYQSFYSVYKKIYPNLKNITS